MPRFFAVVMIQVSIVLSNGCSKCSREEMSPPPPSQPAAESPQQAPMGGSQHVESLSPDDPEQEPPQPATPAFPDDEGSGGEESPD